jgi:hypothetical protein
MSISGLQIARGVGVWCGCSHKVNNGFSHINWASRLRGWKNKRGFEEGVGAWLFLVQAAMLKLQQGCRLFKEYEINDVDPPSEVNPWNMGPLMGFQTKARKKIPRLSMKLLPIKGLEGLLLETKLKF